MRRVGCGRALLWTLLAPFAGVSWTGLQVLSVRVMDPWTTETMVERAAAQVQAGAHPMWPDRRVRSLRALGPTIPRAVLAAEDARFYLHDGFDWESVCSALRHDTHGPAVRGASTITQQTAKNLFLWQDRSWVRKGLEVWYTWLLERLVPKDRILELYLNVAETGPMVFGMEAGARYHFGKPARELTASQAARLAAILPDPRRRSVDGSSARVRGNWVLANPAPFPGDRGWDRLVADWNARSHGPWDCLR